MLARPGQQAWSRALANWVCPTPGGDGKTCDPCAEVSTGLGACQPCLNSISYACCSATQHTGIASLVCMPCTLHAVLLTGIRWVATRTLSHCLLAGTGRMGQLGPHGVPRPQADVYQGCDSRRWLRHQHPYHWCAQQFLQLRAMLCLQLGVAQALVAKHAGRSGQWQAHHDAAMKLSAIAQELSMPDGKSAHANTLYHLQVPIAAHFLIAIGTPEQVGMNEHALTCRQA
jgi:hypothetical protein